MTRWLISLSLVSLGCGAPADPVKGYEAVWQANCDAVAECVSQAPEEDWDWIQQRADECVAGGGTDEVWGETVRAAVEVGRIAYDRAAATTCIKAYRDIDCTVMWDEPISESCDTFLTGLVECDEACSIHEECASGVCRGNLCDCGT